MTPFLLAIATALVASLPAAPTSTGNPERAFDVGSLERLTTGHQFTEGPVWHPDGYLLFTDIPANQILRWDPEAGVSVYRHPSGRANGLAFGPTGALIACEHETRCVSQTPPRQDREVWISDWHGKRFNSPNDLVLDASGQLYFTDPPYGLADRQPELEFSGLFRRDLNGQLHCEYRGHTRPNGVGLAPDGRTLYLADSETGQVLSFVVAPDGSLGTPQVLGQMDDSGADGLALDQQGWIYATGPRGVWVWEPDGTWVGLLETPEKPSNCTFGDADLMSLYVTARSSLYRVRTLHPGLPKYFSTR